MIRSILAIFLSVLFVAANAESIGLAQSAQVGSPLTLERALTLKDSAEVMSDSVCLTDLVSEGWIQGRCSVERKACCRWSMGGERQKIFKRRELQKGLSGISFGAFSLTFSGKDEITVTQTHRELGADEIRNKITEAVSAKLADKPNSISIVSVRMSGPIHVPLQNESGWEIILPEQIPEHLSVKIVSTTDSAQVIGWADVILKHETEVYVSKRTIRPNDLIRVEDFELRKANSLSAEAAGQTLFRKDQFPEGVRARLSILPGTPLNTAAIERLPTVKLGDTVTLILRSDSLRVSTKGVAQGNAAVGDMVTVQLSRYNRTFRGRVLDGRLVEVWL